MSDLLLDTDVLLRCLRGVGETLQFAQQLTEEGDLHISVWSQLEILTLAQPREDKRTLDFLAPFILHPIGDVIAQRAASLLRAGRMSAAPLNFSEALIAATALQHSLTLVTYDFQNFKRLDELKLYPIQTAPDSTHRGGR